MIIEEDPIRGETVDESDNSVAIKFPQSGDNCHLATPDFTGAILVGRLDEDRSVRRLG